MISARICRGRLRASIHLRSIFRFRRVEPDETYTALSVVWVNYGPPFVLETR